MALSEKTKFALTYWRQELIHEVEKAERVRDRASQDLVAAERDLQDRRDQLAEIERDLTL